MKIGMETWDIEYTDTFNGDANYSWAHRYEITVPKALSEASIKRIAKELVDITGVKGVWEDTGDGWQYKPVGSCTILYIRERIK